MGQLFNYFVFFFFGTVVAGFWGHFTPAVLPYAVLSLTVVRMAPVALALQETRLSRATVLFMGWFGHRGLASTGQLQSIRRADGQVTRPLELARTV